MGLRTRSAAALLVVCLAWLPRLAGAGPLVLELREDLRQLGGDERERLAQFLDAFGTAMRADSAAFAAAFAEERAALLRARAADPGFDYPEPLGAWLRAAGGWGSTRETLRAVLAAAPALPPGPADAGRLAVVRVDSLHASPLHLRPGLQPLRLAHKGRLDADPRLAPLLLLSLPTGVAWADARCDPWRGAAAPGGGACPVMPGALPVEFEPWAGPAARAAVVDSLFASTPELRQLGWLKRRFVKKGLASLLASLARQQAAFAECRHQRGEAEAPAGPPPGADPPPRCALGDPAILRLLLAPAGDGRRWALALAWLSPYHFADFASASLEPGYGDWLADYAKWMERVEVDAAGGD